MFKIINRGLYFHCQSNTKMPPEGSEYFCGMLLDLSGLRQGKQAFIILHHSLIVQRSPGDENGRHFQLSGSTWGTEAPVAWGQPSRDLQPMWKKKHTEGEIRVPSKRAGIWVERTLIASTWGELNKSFSVHQTTAQWPWISSHLPWYRMNVAIYMSIYHVRADCSLKMKLHMICLNTASSVT